MDSQKKRAGEATRENTSDNHNVITIVDAGEILTTTYCDAFCHKNSPAPESCAARSVQEHPVTSLDDIEKVFADLYENQHAAVIQGRYVGDEKATRTDGLIKTRHYATENFVDRLSNIVTLGVWVGEEDTDIEQAMFKAIAYLPEVFHGLPFLWAVMPRTDIKKRTVYLTFWLPVAMTMEQIRKALKAKKFSQRDDRDLFPSPDKLIITASPVFENRIVDSVPVRRGRCAGKVSGGIRDQLTVLESLGPKLTKTFKSDGAIESYDNPANFKVRTAEITGWPDLVELLNSLHKNPKRCLIRGKLTGTTSEKPGTFVRTNANFSDQALHWFMVDVDGFEPGFALPTDPAAVEEYIETVLPSFQGASYYWHMSSSAGQSPKLKCHIHFLSKTAYTSAQMKVWAKGIGKQVDSALFSRVQVHYTADPIYEEGRTDPVVTRAGFHQGERDFVDLVITAEARETGAGSDGTDMKLVDPSEKDNIVGLFHKTFSAEQVLLELLEGFEQVSERRYTWHGGGGTPEGVWVHDDGMHVGSSHNTWPISGITNLWDLVRVFKFGQHDQVEDEFEQMDIDSRPIQARPSNIAMLEWVGTLPELQAVQKAEVLRAHEQRAQIVAGLLQTVAAADTQIKLTAEVVPTIKQAMAEHGFLAYELAELESTVSKRFTALSPSKAKLPAKAIREMLAPEHDETTRIFDLEMSLVKQVLGDWFGAGKHLKFIGDSWWIYRHGVWQRTDASLIENRVQRSIQRILAGDDKGAHQLTVLLRESERGDYLNALTSAVCGNLRRHCSRDDRASDPLNLMGRSPDSVINCMNGELWFDDDGNFGFVDHDPGHKLTSQIATDYDPDADCPKFKAALALAFSKCLEPDEVTRHFLELMGTIIQPRRIEAMWMLLKGRGENGKTFLVDIVEAAMGSGSCLKGSIGDAAAGKDNHFTASLIGKLAFIDDDVKQGTLLPDDWLKKLSEEKVLTANPKNASTFQFTSRATMIMLANHWPRTVDTSHGMTRRAHIFEFKHQLTEDEKDPGLKRYIIENELPGVLNLLIEGWQRVLRRGRYQRPAEIVAAGEHWMCAANTTGNFFRQMLKIDTKAPAIKLTIIEQFYRAWMAEHEPRAIPFGKQAFISALRNKGFDVFTQHNQLSVRGVTINPMPGDDAPADYVADAAAEKKAEQEAMRLFAKTFGTGADLDFAS